MKIDNLAIFSIGIKNKMGADSEKDFSISKNIEGVKLRARATGELVSDKLNLDATLKKATALASSDDTTDEGGGDNTPSEDASSGSGTASGGTSSGGGTASDSDASDTGGSSSGGDEY